tara:strand:+ start:363 stop:668 length:306 start_codon:yes stop_codon:yes gene_type:complete
MERHKHLTPLMSEDQLKAFLERVQSDVELQEKVKAAASPQAVIEIALAAGFSISADDIQSTPPKSAELSDQELEAAAGGLLNQNHIPTEACTFCAGCGFTF